MNQGHSRGPGCTQKRCKGPWKPHQLIQCVFPGHLQLLACGARGEDAVVVGQRHLAHGERLAAGALDQHGATGGAAATRVGVWIAVRVAGHVLWRW